LNKDLDFRPDQRHEATRRTAQAAKICNDAGLITIAATISPETTARRQAREIIGEEQFLEVYLCPPQEACEARDTEGLYARARAGEISDFTGIDSPYDPPENADLSLDTNALPLAECMEKLIQLMSVRGIIDGSN
jgi:adenylylsulfate kinase-like enzyme